MPQETITTEAVTSPTRAAFEHDDAFTAVRVGARWDRTRRRMETRQKLGTAEGRLLWLLRDEPLTLKQIAERSGLEQSTVNRQVNAALEAGLLDRTRPADGAAYLISATPAGASAFQADLGRQLRAHRAAVEAVPAAHRAQFLAHLDAFVSRLEEALSETD